MEEEEEDADSADRLLPADSGGAGGDKGLEPVLLEPFSPFGRFDRRDCEKEGSGGRGLGEVLGEESSALGSKFAVTDDDGFFFFFFIQ